MSGRDDAFLATLLGGSLVAVGALNGRVHPHPSPAGRKVVPSPPALYIDDEVEALGRVIASEHGSGSRKEKTYLAWAVRNLARHRKQTIAQMACQPCGKQVGNKRPVSSRLPARPDDLEIAAAVLASPQSEDPTGGATNFLNPEAMDRWGRENRPGYAGKTYAQTRARWIENYGLEPYYRLSERLELWGPKRTKPVTS